jgi:hypothetical protein
MSTENVKEVVREKYRQAAARVTSGDSDSCCGRSGLDRSCDPITANLYDAAQESKVPDTAIKASLGCGNPSIEDARGFLSERGLNVDALVREVAGKFISAFIKASKPATGCCSPGCCS